MHRCVKMHFWTTTTTDLSSSGCRRCLSVCCVQLTSQKVAPSRHTCHQDMGLWRTTIRFSSHLLYYSLCQHGAMVFLRWRSFLTAFLIVGSLLLAAMPVPSCCVWHHQRKSRVIHCGNPQEFDHLCTLRQLMPSRKLSRQERKRNQIYPCELGGIQSNRSTSPCLPAELRQQP